MSFELSFSPEFFLAEGEPYDGGPAHGDRPTSVWGAIQKAMRNPVELRALAEVLGCHGRFVTEEAVLEQVQKVNTCSNLSSPVEVWVDPEGWVCLKVYDSVKP